MARLTQNQISHLTARINEKIFKIIRAAIDNLGPEPQFMAFKPDEVIQAIERGNFIIDTQYIRKNGIHASLVNSLKIPEPKRMREHNDEVRAYQRQVKQIRDHYDKRAQQLTDLAVLGDSDEALRMLAALENELDLKKNAKAPAAPTAPKRPKRVPKAPKPDTTSK